MNGTQDYQRSEFARNANPPIGMCQCGCGKPAQIAKRSLTKLGHVRGKPVRFICGHQSKGQCLKGGIIIRRGYVVVSMRDKNPLYYPFHRILAENVIGKSLAPKAVVHHFDGNGINNTNTNLVVCEDNAYHHFLHQRKRAYNECGNPKWRKCNYCKTYDNPKFLYINKYLVHHLKCHETYNKNRRLLND